MLSVNVLYEDENLLAVDKPAGLLVHGVRGKHFREGTQREEDTLVDWIVKNRPEIKNVGDIQPHTGQMAGDRPGIVHRLDRQTSGVMLIAKTQEYFEYLKNLFKTKDIQKTYLALVHGNLEGEGRIDKPIGLKDGSVKRTVHVIAPKTKMIREAATKYEVLRHLTLNNEHLTLLKVEPLTGRTHQIRVHLASIGHPVVGDKLYGSKGDMEKLNRHFLHAESIEFDMPSSKGSAKRIKISAPLPEELARLVR